MMGGRCEANQYGGMAGEMEGRKQSSAELTEDGGNGGGGMCK
jgi:hypothetical protein